MCAAHQDPKEKSAALEPFYTIFIFITRHYHRESNEGVAVCIY